MDAAPERLHHPWGGPALAPRHTRRLRGGGSRGLPSGAPVAHARAPSRERCRAGRRARKLAGSLAVGEKQGPAAPAAPPRGLIRQLRADPNHAPETFVLFAVDRLGDGALDFADRARRADPGLTPAELSARVHDRTVGLARIDGAVAGCPFLLALVPAYVAMLWEQARMALRIGALY